MANRNTPDNKFCLKVACFESRVVPSVNCVQATRQRDLHIFPSTSFLTLPLEADLQWTQLEMPSTSFSWLHWFCAGCKLARCCARLRLISHAPIQPSFEPAELARPRDIEFLGTASAKRDYMKSE
jgi:hypothetical protein